MSRRARSLRETWPRVSRTGAERMCHHRGGGRSVAGGVRGQGGTARATTPHVRASPTAAVDIWGGTGQTRTADARTTAHPRATRRTPGRFRAADESAQNGCENRPGCRAVRPHERQRPPLGAESRRDRQARSASPAHPDHDDMGHPRRSGRKTKPMSVVGDHAETLPLKHPGSPTQENES